MSGLKRDFLNFMLLVLIAITLFFMVYAFYTNIRKFIFMVEQNRNKYIPQQIFWQKSILFRQIIDWCRAELSKNCATNLW